MTDVLFYLTMFLCVVAVWLLWRVYRLEGVAGQAHDWGFKAVAADSVRRSFEARDRVDDDLRADWVRTDTKLHQFARALGYEWKRTDAKEGWEKKVTLAEALKETCGGGTPFASSFRTVHYDDIPKYTLDRRKADRRKPAPDIFVSKPCAKCDARAAKEAVESVERDINRPWTKADLKSVFGPGGKKPAKKKPRRAH